MMERPRVAFFDFTSCEGCQLQVVDLEEDLLKIVGAPDIVSFREELLLGMPGAGGALNIDSHREILAMQYLSVQDILRRLSENGYFLSEP